MKHPLLVTATALVHLVLPAVAADPDAWLKNGLLTPEMVAAIKPELGLSEDQETRMNGIAAQAREKAAPLESEVRQQQRQFLQTLRQPNIGPDAAAAALDRLMEAEAQVKHLQLRTLLSLRDVLNAEQQKKAIRLAPERRASLGGVEERMQAKAFRLRSELETMGIPATERMTERGREIENLVRQGMLPEAEKALDRLVAESEVDQEEDLPAPDFSRYEPGEVEVDILKIRYQQVQEAAQNVVSVRLLRQLMDARDALEVAKAAEDARQVGRILSWAESVLD